MKSYYFISEIISLDPQGDQVHEEDGCEEDTIPDIFDFCEPLEGNNEPSSTKNKSN